MKKPSKDKKASKGEKRKYANLSNYVVAGICDRLYRSRTGLSAETVEQIADSVAADQGIKFTREEVYPVALGEGIRRNYFRYVPPVEEVLTQDFRETFGYQHGPGRPRTIQVVAPGVPARPEHLAAVAADTLFHQVKRISALSVEAREKALGALREPAEGARLSQDAVEDMVIRIGLGAGFTTANFAQHFAAELRTNPDERPRIVLKAISPPFSTHEQRTAPHTFFDFFARIEGVSCEWFNAPSYMLTEGYGQFTESPGVREAFKERMGLDIVVTSFGSRSCGHGDFTKFMHEHAVEDGAGVAWLKGKQWVGDVLRLPFSPDGPIAFETKFRPVSLYTLDDLVTLAADPRKSVILIAGPCQQCGHTRESALLPLLENEKLLVWSHLVLDAETADACLKLRGGGNTQGDGTRRFILGGGQPARLPSRLEGEAPGTIS